MQLKNYQINAVNGLIEKSKKLLEIGNKSLILKSPTGSGKTIILAEFIQRFIKDHASNNKFSFVWFAPRKLHIQSKEKLQKYFKDSKTIKCSLWANLIYKKKISSNEIFFCNWPSINSSKNNIREEREGEIFIDKFIENTKFGYKTIVGERGITLSGGQIQRIAIARAIYRRPQILFLDEATSALDINTEEKIINNIFKDDIGYTVFLISHKLQTLRKCDTLYHLNKQSLQKVDVKEVEKIFYSENLQS